MASTGERNSRLHPMPLFFEDLRGTDPTPNPSPWRGGEWDAEAFTLFRGKHCLQAPPLQGEGLGVGSLPLKVAKGSEKWQVLYNLFVRKIRNWTRSGGVSRTLRHFGPPKAGNGLILNGS